jgi:hypothetical protein
MGLNIFNDDALSGEGSGAKRTGSDTYFESFDRIVVKIRQARGRAIQ